MLIGRRGSGHRCVAAGGCAWWYAHGLLRISPPMAPTRTKSKAYSNSSVFQSPPPLRSASPCALQRSPSPMLCGVVGSKTRRIFRRRASPRNPANLPGPADFFHRVRSTVVSLGLFSVRNYREAHQTSPTPERKRRMASSAESRDGDLPTEVGPAPDQPSVPQGSVTSVRVAVRVRPLVSMETAAGCQECMFGDSDNNQARERRGDG